MTNVVVLAPRRGLLPGLVGVAALLVLAGCGGGSGDGSAAAVSGRPSSAAGTATGTATAAANSADVLFARNMIPHHQQAVQMADLALRTSGDPAVKQLAEQIKAAQDPEIRTMTTWMSSWGRPMMSAGPMSAMPGMGGMAGMMSGTDMTRLMDAKGASFDRMFAQMMIIHHQGAIQMARDELANGADPAAKALAAGIERSQTAELTTLRTILNQR